MKAIVVTDQAEGTAGMKLVDRPEPRPAINDVIVEVRAAGYVPTEVGWPSTWVDRAGTRPSAVDPRPRVRRSCHSPRLRNNRAVGRPAGLRDHGLAP